MHHHVVGILSPTCILNSSTFFFFFPQPASQVQATNTQSFAWTIVTASQLPQLILCILSPSCNLYRMQIWPCQLPSEDFQWKLKIKKNKDFQWLPSALSIKTQVLVVAKQAPLILSHLICLVSLLPSHLRLILLALDQPPRSHTNPTSVQAQFIWYTPSWHHVPLLQHTHPSLYFLCYTLSYVNTVSSTRLGTWWVEHIVHNW